MILVWEIFAKQGAKNGGCYNIEQAEALFRRKGTGFVERVFLVDGDEIFKIFEKSKKIKQSRNPKEGITSYFIHVRYLVFIIAQIKNKSIVFKCF